MKKLIIFLTILLMPTICFAKPHETAWSPDTCNGCKVVYEWDDEIPEEQRVYKFKLIEKEEPAFHDLSPEEQYNHILEENQRKNKVYAEAKKINSSLEPDKFNYYFDSQRKLIVSAPGIKKSDESRLETAVEGDKVDVE